MKNSQSLTLAFSCLGEKLVPLINHIKSLDLADSRDIHVLIIVQKSNESNHLLNLPKYIKVIFLSSVGLSKSRNAVIKHSSTDYVWFLDDDVELSGKYLNTVLEKLNSDDATEFYRVKIGCLEWEDRTFKTYRKIKRVTKLNLLQVSSIEIIANLSFIKNHTIEFNENIGLGTKFRGGEEIHFLLDAWDAGARFEFIDEVLVRHTCIFEERVLATPDIFEIRGGTASRFGFLGFLLMARWSLRYLIKERKLSYVNSMFKGFFKGYKSFQ